MAKALFGHVGPAADARLVAELQRVRRRVAELEDEVARLRKANAVLAKAIEAHEDVLSITVPDSLPETAEALA